ncbi:MAG: acetylxylan esterase [Limisphaerales bacterium]
MKNMKLGAVISAALVAGTGTGSGQPADALYDEAKVPAYTLPDPLRFNDGRTVTTANQWTDARRAEILELYREHVYGRSPGRPRDMRFDVFESNAEALGGKATRKQVRVRFTDAADGPGMDLLIYVPNRRPSPAPVFLGLNFEGNHAISADPAIRLARGWVANNEKEGRIGNRATEASRGSESSRWAVDRLIERGYAVATVYYGDLEPDFAEGWKQGVRSVFPVDGSPLAVAAGEPIRELAPDAWGAIGAWAWGLSRAMDYLETDRDLDSKRVAVMGHSRLGKTSLWAGAQDERFAIVISNNSGEGGAALARRRFGETTKRINTVFPHWFCGNFKQYNDREDAIPVDQHELIALAAPRPIYVASAEKDLWADPRGEFLAAKGAGPVYALLGFQGVTVEEPPELDQPVGDRVGYHRRTGAHDVLPYDWEQYMDFADRHYRRAAKP